MELTVFHHLLLGMVQGIAEWLPISSSGMIALIMTNFFEVTDVSSLVQGALFLHLGTFFSALVYFWKDILGICSAPFKKNSPPENKKTFNFILIVTIISGLIGLIFLKFLTSFEDSLEITGKTITFVIGFLLLLTGIIQLKVRAKGFKKSQDLKSGHGILLGFSQGLAIFPGLSRSGITVSTLLLKKFDDTTALKLSFLMGLPIILIGNIILNWSSFSLDSMAIYGLLTSFVFGFLTIHGLMKISKKINFGWFVLIFAILMMLSVLI